MMNFRYEPRSDHLLVEATGNFDPPAAKEAVARMVSACAENALKKVFVDARGLQEVMSLADRFDLVTYFTAQNAPIRVAVLVTPTQAEINATQRAAPVDRAAALHTTSNPEEAFGFLGLQKPG